jgi:uncharacterized membrane protein
MRCVTGRLLALWQIMRARPERALIPLTLLASATGARTFSGLAAISRRPPTKMFAAGELIFDKVPSVPSRLAPSSLIGRVAAGAIVGAIVGHRTGNNRVGSALVGGAIAFASAHLTYRMRRALGEHMPATAAAIVEDGVVVGAATTGATLLRRNSRHR